MEPRSRPRPSRSSRAPHAARTRNTGSSTRSRAHPDGSGGPAQPATEPASLPREIQHPSRGPMHVAVAPHWPRRSRLRDPAARAGDRPQAASRTHPREAGAAVQRALARRGPGELRRRPSGNLRRTSTAAGSSRGRSPRRVVLAYRVDHVADHLGRHLRIDRQRQDLRGGLRRSGRRRRHPEVA